MIFIGVDGGGTKTAFLAYDGAKTYSLVLREPANPNTVGAERSFCTVRSGTERLCRENALDTSDIRGIFCGIAGATNGDFRGVFADRLRAAFPGAKCAVDHDGQNILAAAFGTGDGTIIICGTGSSCFARGSGATHRIGGYLTFDLAGSGYEIGRAAIAHAFCCCDGRAKKGALWELVRAGMGEAPLDALSGLLAADRNAIAAYTPYVFEAYRRGDTYAAAILGETAEFLAGYAAAASRYFTDGFGICVAGSVGTNPVMLSLLRDAVKCRADIFPLTAEPVTGALIIAKNL